MMTTAAEDKKRFDLRVDAIRWYAKHPPKDDIELRRLVKAITGSAWLESRNCTKHQTPWDLLSAGYFTKTSEILGVGPRGGYKTMTLGLLNAIEMIVRPGIQLAHASASLGQATRARQWTKNFLVSEVMKASAVTGPQITDAEKALDGISKIGEKPELAKYQKWIISLPNGSTLEIVPATMTGLNSLHPNRLHLDEFELLKPQVIEEARLVPQSFGGYDRGLIEVSSRKFRNGNVDSIMYDRKFKDLLKIVWCVAETTEECVEERRGKAEAFYDVPELIAPGAPPTTVKAFEKCGTCALLPDCRGQFAKSRGWGKIVDLISEATTTDRSTWIAQKRSERVEEPTGNFFSRFGPKNLKDFEPDPAEPLRLAADFGGGGEGNTAVLFWQLVNGDVRVLAEYIGEKTSEEDDVPAVEGILAELFENLRVDPSPGDCAQPNVLKRWNDLAKKFQLYPVKKLHTKREMVNVLSGMIQPASGQPRYYVHSRCTTHIEEIRNFKANPKAVDGRVKQLAFADRDVDTVDAATYLALEVGDLGEGQSPTVWVASVREKRVESSDQKSGPVRVETGDPKKNPFSDGKELTWDNYVGEKFRRLLARGR